MKSKLTNTSYWEAHWGEEKVLEWDSGEKVFLPDWHKKFSEQHSDAINGKECFEVGCFPGRYMRYFAREYQMNVDGIDLMPYKSNLVSEPLNVSVADFIEYEGQKQYDIVCSFGFLEHFGDLHKVISKHLSMTRKEGITWITMPNYVEGWRFFLKRLFDRKLFESHNEQAMKIAVLEEVLSQIECESYEISVVRYSEKIFSSSGKIRAVLGRLIQRFLVRIPYLDQKFSTEITITIWK